MALNLGYIELGGGGVVARIYYDATFEPVGEDQPLINGPRGYCLDLTNATGKTARVTIRGLRSQPLTVNVGVGDPVTSGAGRSRTVAVLNTAGFTTRGDVGQIEIS